MPDVKGLECDECGKMFVTQRMSEGERCLNEIDGQQCGGSLRLLATFAETYRYDWGYWLQEVSKDG